MPVAKPDLDLLLDRPYLYPKQLQAIYEPKRYSLIEASTKAGKAQPLDSLIYTPMGPIRMGDIQVGDEVLTPDSRARVVAIYPQGRREVWRLTFADGTIVETDADHLWEVHQFKGAPKIVTTTELLSWPQNKLHRTWVPEIAPCAFREMPVPIDPYLLGALIGDGGLTSDSAMFSNADAEVLDAVRACLPAGHTLVKSGDQHDWRISAGSDAAIMRESKTHLRGMLQRMGLGGKGSYEKFIPDEYRYNSYAVRIAVLQGIFDTDGFVDKHSQPGIEQTSEQLARDIEEVVQSLGGSVLTRLRQINGYRAKDGRFVTCRPVWRQVIRMADGSKLFSLDRKRSLCKPKRKTGHRMFRKIEFVRHAETQCIEIDDDRNLYLTDGLIPTHNTSGCISWIVEMALSARDGQNFWWVAPISDQALIAFRRAMRAIPQDLFTPNISLKTITLVNGAVIWFKSGDKPNSLYGEDVYGVVVDEASRMKEDAYIAIRSTLTYTRAPIRIIGNVRGRKNWFFRLARRAEQRDDPEMGYHKIIAQDAVDAGVLDAKEIDDARTQMPEQSWRELYLAEPSDDGGNPFGIQHITACTLPDLQPGPPVVWGWDLAKKQDWAVGIGLNLAGNVCRFERFQHIPWDQIIERIKQATGGVPALVDSTGVGDPIIDILQKIPGTKFEGYHFTAASKQKLMEGLAVAIQGRHVSFPEGPIPLELSQFEFEYTRTGVRYCVDPTTPILTDNLRWVPAGTLHVGDGLLAFDEYARPGNKSRCWRSSTVTHVDEIIRPCYRVSMADGAVLIVSAEHLWLVESAGRLEWRKTEDLQAPHATSRSSRFAPTRIVKLLDTWQEPQSYRAGYLAAAFDGEGSIGQASRNDHRGNGARLTFAQRENAMAQQVRKYLSDFGFTWSESLNGNGAGTCKNFGLTGRRHEFLRFLGQIRPHRLLKKFDPERLGTLEQKEAVAVAAIEFLGPRPVTAIGTTTKTFVADGFASHNSAPEGFHDDCVCALALAVMHKLRSPAQMNITEAMIAEVVQAGMMQQRRRRF